MTPMRPLEKRSGLGLSLALATIVLLLWTRADGIASALRFGAGTLEVFRAVLAEGVDPAKREQALQAAHDWQGPAFLGECGARGVAGFELGNADFRVGQWERAIAMFGAAVDSGCFRAGDYRLVAAYARLGELYAQGNDPHNAAANLRLALANSVRGAQGYFLSQTAVLLGDELAGLGRTDEAAHYYEIAASLDHHNHAPYHRLMELHLRLGDYASVLRWHDRLAALYPADPWGPYFLGEMHARLGEPDLAAASFRRAVELDPSNEQALVALAHAHASVQDWDLAAQAMRAALALNPDAPHYHTLLDGFTSNLQSGTGAP